MGTHIDPAVIARAKYNFERRHARDRAWDTEGAAPKGGVWCLTEAERTEYLAQAQYEISRTRPGLPEWLILDSTTPPDARDG
jgi:hypothetical protein